MKLKIMAEYGFIPIAGISHMQVVSLTFEALRGISFHKHHVRCRLTGLICIDISYAFNLSDKGFGVGIFFYL